jgi:hypothetical protein
VFGVSANKMNCPHCNKRISDKVLAKHLASKGGSATGPSKARSSEQARAAVMARIKKLGQKRRKLEEDAEKL